ncbi:MAG: hypothetical protein RR452_04015 [Clostridia bacterium]
MKDHYDLCNVLHTFDGNTKISRIEFESHFKIVPQTVVFTFGGWDGKSYDGESRRARVLCSNLMGFEQTRFVKVGNSVHAIIEDSSVIEKATGETHPTVCWMIDVARA